MSSVPKGLYQALGTVGYCVPALGKDAQPCVLSIPRPGSGLLCRGQPLAGLDSRQIYTTLAVRQSDSCY